MHISRANYKMLAILFMLIDHSGAILFGNNLIMRLIGRLSFPMFVYLLYDGYHNTRDVAAYGRRMVWFWVISVVPYSMAFYSCLISVQQNVFLSLFMYLAIFCILDDTEIPIQRKYTSVVICAVLAECFHMEYGWYGVALAVIIFVCKDSRQAANQFVWITCLDSIWHLNPRQCFAPLAFILTPVRFADSKRPPAAFKIFTYVFYPLHLMLLWALSAMY